VPKRCYPHNFLSATSFIYLFVYSSSRHASRSLWPFRIQIKFLEREEGRTTQESCLRPPLNKSGTQKEKCDTAVPSAAKLKATPSSAMPLLQYCRPRAATGPRGGFLCRGNKPSWLPPRFLLARLGQKWPSFSGALRELSLWSLPKSFPTCAAGEKRGIAGRKIEITEWPPNSPDFSPIENAWARVKSDLERNYPQLLNSSFELPQRELKEEIVTAIQDWDGFNPIILRAWHPAWLRGSLMWKAGTQAVDVKCMYLVVAQYSNYIINPRYIST
jgi:hypothetical protein